MDTQKFDLLKKITEIFIRERSYLSRMFDQSDDRDCFAWVTDRNPNVMYLNPKYSKWKEISYLSLEELMTIVITHENIHHILDKIVSTSTSRKLDNVMGRIGQSRFLINGDWECLKKSS